ncbi:MAG: helix-turn-helix transcriptional regulator, partial [Clostridia bacterium]|nr:helix-turn-helix transcriptional regulator [Clostridia bacterium]
MSFSENLKKIRREHRLSQEELAELLDVSRQAVSKWEQGQGYPEVEKLLLLSSKLNVSLDALMSVEIKHDAGIKSENRSGLIVIISP